MIHNHDRSKWFGASDTYTIMRASTSTDSFAKWWATKLGLLKSNFTNTAMAAGTAYEHKILEAFDITQMDRQVKIRKLRLRVNLDGETDDEIIEVKTHHIDKPFKVSTAYWMQAQVEMFATGKHQLKILSYALKDEDYENFYNEIDPTRAEFHTVLYDESWITNEYLPRLRYFRQCLREKVKPI